MNEIEIKPIAFLISFVIWLDLDITIYRNFAKNKYKRKSEEFKKIAKSKGNYVMGKAIKIKYHSSWEDSKGKYHQSYNKVTYEYIVNGKQYKRKLCYSSDYPHEQYFYYKAGNPKKSYAETEMKNGFIYTLLSMCGPLSIFIGIPLLAWAITIFINMF